MSDIRFNQWLHQSGTGGVSQVASGAVGVGTTNPLADFYVRGDAQITGILTAGHIAMGSSITFGDDDRAYFGDGTDLQIYHSGSHSFIQDTGTGDLKIRSSNVRIEDTSGNLIINASPTSAYLYSSGNAKFGTAGWGAQVTGILKVLDSTDSGGSTNNLSIGTGNDLKLFHDSSHSYISNTTGHLTIQNNVAGHIINLQPKAGANGVITRYEGASELYHNGSKKFETTSTGATVTGRLTIDGLDLGDSETIRLGASQDLQLFHNGSHSYISDLGTGDLRITGSAVHIQNAAQSENMIKCFEGDRVEIYHNNSKKFNTTTTGVTVTGNVDAGTGGFLLSDDGRIRLGTGFDFELYHDGSHSIINDSAGSLLVRSNVVQISTPAGSKYFKGQSGVAELYHSDSKKLETTSAGVYVTGALNVSTTMHIPDGSIGLQIGNSNDMRLYHDGTSNVILANSGDLNIRMNSSENAIVSRQNAAVELYHNNIKKCETTTTGLSITGTVSPTTPLSHRNFLINGSTTIWQRGTDSNLHTSSGTYTCDRWWRANGATRVVRSTAVPAGFPYSLEVYSNGGTTSIGQAIELSGTGRSQFKHSTQYTLSFYARTVTGTNDISANVYYRNDKFSTTNQTNWSGSAGNNSLWLMGTMTTSWQRFYKTFTSPGNPHANNKVLAIEFNNTSAYYITGIQFEEGAVTPFEFRNYQEELANCQRYYENVTGPSLQTTSHSETLIGVAQAYTTSRALMNYKYSVQKRQHPALECSSASNVQILVPSTGWISAGNVYGYTNQMASRVDLRNISGSPLTVGHACEVRVINDGVIGFNAEL